MTRLERSIHTAAAAVLFMVASSWVQADEPPQPSKVEVTAAGEQRIDAKIPVRVLLEDAWNRPAVAREETKVEVRIAGPRLVETKLVIIAAGQSGASFVWTPRSVGVTVLRAREANDRLLSGSDAVLVKPARDTTPPAPAPKPRAPVRRAPVRRAPSGSLGDRLDGALASIVPSIVVLAQAPAPDESLFSRPHLMVQISGRDSGILANGADAAKVHVFYAAEAPAPTDIKVWFKWAGGWVEPQPAVIRKGESEAEALWKASAPGEASLKITISAPDLPWSQTSDLRVVFVPPIKGLEMFGATEMSFLDDELIVARLVDFEGKVARSGVKRLISFLNDNPVAHVNPGSVELGPDQSEARVSVRPAGFSGHALIQAAMPGYAPASHPIKITWLMAVLLCLVGGVLGGIVGHVSARKGSSLPRWLLLGALVGTVLAAGAELGLFLVFGMRIPHGMVLVPVLSFLGGGGWGAVAKLGKGVFTAATKA